MIRKSGHRLSEKILLRQKDRARYPQSGRATPIARMLAASVRAPAFRDNTRLR